MFPAFSGIQALGRRFRCCEVSPNRYIEYFESAKRICLIQIEQMSKIENSNGQKNYHTDSIR
jgi:hypothetical protein